MGATAGRVAMFSARPRYATLIGFKRVIARLPQPSGPLGAGQV